MTPLSRRARGLASARAKGRCTVGSSVHAAAALALALALAAGLAGAACGDDDGAAQNNNRNDTGPAQCGNGVLEAGEACDDGAANSDLDPDACRTDCRLPRCGDSVVDTGELCDEGPANSDRVPGACRTDCALPGCGDGVVDPGNNEECDQGALNSDTEPGACRMDCTEPRCGDGVPDPGQICYAFHAIAAPKGILLPADLDGDGLDDLVGSREPHDYLVQVVRNTGTGLAYGRSYVASPSWGGTDLPGRLLGSGGWAIVRGKNRPVLATIDAEARIRAPTAHVVSSLRASELGIPAIGVTVAGGQRYAVYLAVRSSELCAVPVAPDGAFDPFGESCAPVDLSDLPFGVDGFWLGAALTALPGTAGPAVALRSGTGNGVLVFRLDGQAGFVDQHWYEAMTTVPNPIASLTFLVPAARGDAARTPTLVHLTYGQSTTLAEVALRPWDPATRTFAATPTYVPVPSSTLLKSQIVLLSAGDHGGSGSWQDLIVSTPGAFGTSLFRLSGATYVEDLTCTGGAQIVAAASVRRGGAHDDLVLAAPGLGGQPRLLVYPSVGPAGCAGVTPTTAPLPFEPGAMRIVDLGGDSRDAVLVSPGMPGTSSGETDEHPGAVWLPPGEAAAADLEVGVATRGFSTIPRPAPDAGQELLFDYQQTSQSGSVDPILGLLRWDGSAFVAPSAIRAEGGPPIAFHRVKTVIADLDGDGQDDLLLLEADDSWSQYTVHVFTGPFVPGAGFASHSSFPAAPRPATLAIGDLDGDGLPELLSLQGAVAEDTPLPHDEVTLRPNLGGGTFGPPIALRTAINPRLVTVADLDGDGHQDLVTLHGDAGMVRVFLNAGQGPLGPDRFDTGTDYLTPGRGYTLSAFDLDADGAVDLVVSTPAHGMGPIWLRGRGDGTFEEAEDLALTASELGVGPMNATGAPLPDLMVVTMPDPTDFRDFSTLVLKATP